MTLSSPARVGHNMLNPAPAVCIGDLPDAVLERCLVLACSSLKQRCEGQVELSLRSGPLIAVLNTAASLLNAAAHPPLPPTPPLPLHRLRLVLVCRRFAAAVCSPQLLRDVDAGQLGKVRALRAFTGWLLRHSAHVQRLNFSCYFNPCLSAVEEASTAATVYACLEAVGRGGQLTELGIGRPPGTGWLAAMPSLRQLAIAAEGYARLQLSAAISGLTALSRLHLDGETSCEAGMQLPASITQVHLSRSGSLRPSGSQHLFEQASRVAPA